MKVISGIRFTITAEWNGGYRTVASTPVSIKAIPYTLDMLNDKLLRHIEKENIK